MLVSKYSGKRMRTLTIDIFGGFLITKRMLDLFRRPTDPPEYSWLYTIPAAIFGGGFVWASSTGLGGLVQAGYFLSTLLSIGALTGLSSQVGVIHIAIAHCRSQRGLVTHWVCSV